MVARSVRGKIALQPGRRGETKGESTRIKCQGTSGDADGAASGVNLDTQEGDAEALHDRG